MLRHMLERIHAQVQLLKVAQDRQIPRQLPSARGRGGQEDAVEWGGFREKPRTDTALLRADL